MSTPETILITGGTGTVGRRIVEQLAGRPGVRALAHSDASAEQLAEHGLDVRRGATEDGASLADALDGADALFLLMPFTRQQGAAEIAALEAARAAGVRRVVKLSSVNEGRDIAIMRGHAAASRRARELGFDHLTILQPDNFMDNELGALDGLRAGALYANSGDARLALVDARDIAAVAVAELTAERPHGGDLVITGPEALTYAEWAARLGAAAGVELSHVSPPDADFEAALLGAGLPGFLAAGLTEMYASIRSTGGTVAPTDVVEHVAGRPPHTPEDFARDVLAPLLAPA
jgi:uncharacterized protein YbjT (DUF2867 family)